MNEKEINEYLNNSYENKNIKEETINLEIEKQNNIYKDKNNNYSDLMIEKQEKIYNEIPEINVDNKNNNSEEEIKEEIIIESSSSRKNKNENVNTNIFPKNIKKEKMKNIQKQKQKLNNSFKLSPKKHLITSLNELNNNPKNNLNLSTNTKLYIGVNNSKNNNNNNYRSKNNNNYSNHFLPRISSSQSIKKPNLNNKNIFHKQLQSEIPNKKKEKLILPQKPHILFKKNNKDNELIDIQKEHLNLIQELQKLNVQLTDLINKQIPQAIINYSKYKKRKNLPSPEIIRHNKIITKKKLLTNLIIEYNSIYNKFSLGCDIEMKNELENKIKNIKEEYNDNKNLIKNLKEQITKNDNYLKNRKKQEFFSMNDSDDLLFKNELYEQKISQIKNNILQMENLLENENKTINHLNDRYLKYKEIINYYDETPQSIENKLKNYNEIKKKEEEMEKLKRKKDIIIHSRNTMNKKYSNEINKQNKYIEQLNKEIEDIDNILNSND